MNDQIISREQIRAKARAAHAAGRSRNSHGMNPGAPALTDWLAEFDRLTTASLASTRAFLLAADEQFERRAA